MAQEDAQLRILCIDDNPDLLNLLAKVLMAEGHTVVTASSAEEALEYLPYHIFQIAFIDQVLPGMEGLVLGEFLRRHNPDMRIALVTGEVDDVRLRRASHRADITFIPKPFEIEQILDVVAGYLTAAERRRQERRRAQDPEFAPPIRTYYETLPTYFSMPNIPNRIEDLLGQKVKACLNDLRSSARYNERTRVLALAGLLTAQVLGTKLPKTKDGRTLFEEFDDAMIAHGRRTEFSDPS